MDFPLQYCSNKNINGNDELDIRTNIIKNERKNVDQNKQQLNNGGRVILLCTAGSGKEDATISTIIDDFLN